MSPKKQGAAPSRYNIQLIPRNTSTEVQMTRFGYNSKLQYVSLGRLFHLIVANGLLFVI